MSEPGLFEGVLARGGAREEVGDRAWLQAMLDVEAALARAEARAGVISTEAAEAIARACVANSFDAAEIGRSAMLGGNPVIPLVEALTARVEEVGRGDVHRGATSQDILDTSAMLVAGRSLEPIVGDLGVASEAAAALARAHRDTPMAGRTMLQHALPITFGLKAAVWMTGLDAAGAALETWVQTRRAVQLGGAAGTLASLGDKGATVLAYLAEDLQLQEPFLPWHTDRTRIAELAGALGGAAGATGKPAADVLLMAQTEVGELAEGVEHRGGSSTMPHKRNPIAATAVLACSRRVPGLVANLMASAIHEHERAAGSWHAEWIPFSELLVAVGASAAWLRDCLESLELDVDRMRTNLDITGGLLLTERVGMVLSGSLGRLGAHEVLQRIASELPATGADVAAHLEKDPLVSVHLSRAEIDELLNPTTYLGCAGTFVDRALAAHDERR